MKIKLLNGNTLYYVGKLYYRLLKGRSYGKEVEQDSYMVQYKSGLFGKWKTHTEWEVFTQPAPEKTTRTIMPKPPENAFPINSFSREHACECLFWLKHYDSLGESPRWQYTRKRPVKNYWSGVSKKMLLVREI